MQSSLIVILLCFIHADLIKASKLFLYNLIFFFKYYFFFLYNFLKIFNFVLISLYYCYFFLSSTCFKKLVDFIVVNSVLLILY